MSRAASETTRAAAAELRDRVDAAKRRLRAKLLDLDVGTSGVSEYNQRYLASKLECVDGTLQLYGSLLLLALKDHDAPVEDLVLVDYGGGSGLISMLACEAGVGTVVYNDIYDVSCSDVTHLAGLLGLSLEHVVCGDVDALLAYVRDGAVTVDALMAYDVLEHIYDVEEYFTKLGGLSSGRLRVVHASGANTSNPRIVRMLRKEQVEAESHDRDKQWGHKERDSLRAYADRRADIVFAYGPDLTPAVVGELARATRGMMRPDIERIVDDYRRTGAVPAQPDDPTNTCDPDTGNWCEHLMDLGWLERTVRERGFSVEILTGRYDACGPAPKKAAKALLNVVLGVSGKAGMIVAPYYVVYANAAPSAAPKG